MSAGRVIAISGIGHKRARAAESFFITALR
jgi:hypothetical protein